MNSNLLDLPVTTLITLASGYIGYCIANTGIRDHHKQIDTAFLTLVYGVVGMIAYNILAIPLSCFWKPLSIICGTIAAFGASAWAGAYWRKTGKDKLKKFLNEKEISYADDLPSAWLGLFDVKTHTNEQLTVIIKDGTVYHCNNLSEFKDEPNGPCYLGPNGDVLMYVTNIYNSEGNELKHPPIKDPDWGNEITYLPASEICRVYLRRKQKEKIIS